jgi:PPOX class probable F420-dependent enzyme
MSRRDQIIMTADEVSTYLENKLTIVINSIGKDGVPHPAPMWFAVEDDGAIVMTTFTKSQKIQNLKRDPRVTLLLEDGTVYAELRGVIFHGVAELEEDVDAVVAILAAIGRRDSGGGGETSGVASALSEAEQAGLRAQAVKRTAMRIRPTKVVSWDHRKLGGVY